MNGCHCLELCQYDRRDELSEVIVRDLGRLSDVFLAWDVQQVKEYNEWPLPTTWNRLRLY